MAKSEKIKYGRTETLQLEDGTRVQAWAMYERTADERESYKGQPVAWFVQSHAAKQYSQIQDTIAAREDFHLLLATILHCDPTVDQIHQAVERQLGTITGLKQQNAALERKIGLMEEQAGTVLAGVQQFMRVSTGQAVIIQTDERPAAEPAPTDAQN